MFILIWELIDSSYPGLIASPLEKNRMYFTVYTAFAMSPKS